MMLNSKMTPGQVVQSHLDTSLRKDVGGTFDCLTHPNEHAARATATASKGRS